MQARHLVSGAFLTLYVILDLFSRYVVAWMVAERENSALAQQLFAEAIARYDFEPGKLIVHQDGFADLLSARGVDRSYSRPRVPNDNHHQESNFHEVSSRLPGTISRRAPRPWRCHDFVGPSASP